MTTDQDIPEPKPLHPDVQKIWAQYAYERFVSAENRIKEFRNWARQLAAAVAVVIGLEVNVITKVLDTRPAALDAWLAISLAVLFSAVTLKIFLLFSIFRLGYSPRDLMDPEGPQVLRTLFIGQREDNAREIIARYYANASDGSPGCDGSYALAEELGRGLAKVSQRTAYSLALLLLGVGVSALGILQRSYNPAMAQPAKSPPTSTPAATTPAPATPSPIQATLKPTAPSLPTPTPGRTTKLGAQPTTKK